jgi:glycosyltransferase involved in cell wall biosynthesis
MKGVGGKKLRICMLLPLRFGSNIKLLYPSIEIFSYLTSFGHEITWIISAEEGYQFQQHVPDGVKAGAVYYPRYFSGYSIWLKNFNYIPYLWRRTRLIFRVFRDQKYDLFFVKGGIFDDLLAMYVKRKYRIPLVVYLANPLEQPTAELRLDPKKPVPLFYMTAKLKEFLNACLVSRADLVLTVSIWLKEHLVEKGYPEYKMLPTPTGVNINVFLNGNKGDICERYNLHNSKVILYIGVLAKPRSLALLVEAFAILTANNENIKLLMVGDGNDRENLTKLGHNLGVKGEIVFTGQVHKSEVPDFVAAADIGVSIIPPISFYKLSSPIKMLEYMAGGKPVVANEEIFDHKQVLEQSAGGILVQFTPESFAEAMIKLLNNPELSADMGRRGKEWVTKNRSYEILARRVEERYLKLVQTEDWSEGNYR